LIGCPAIGDDRKHIERRKERDEGTSGSHAPMSGVDALDRLLGRLMGAARWGVLPLALLLWLQWPLRELLQAGSRQANDLGQIVFALYVAPAITEATRRGTHLQPHPVAARWAQRRQRPLRAAALLLGLLPWSLFVLVSSATPVWQSLLEREAFPDSFNPGYFLIKLALWLLAGCVALQALIDLRRLLRGPAA
jgi:TRAP-type C4-dicarboxylate transport system permease small subunit